MATTYMHILFNYKVYNDHSMDKTNGDGRGAMLDGTAKVLVNALN